MTKIFLIIFTIGYGAGPQWRIQMPDLKTCYEAIEKSKRDLSQGDENELGYIMICGNDTLERHKGGTWSKSVRYPK